MRMRKPILILQLRPEDDTSDGEFAAILKYGGLDARDVRRLRLQKIVMLGAGEAGRDGLPRTSGTKMSAGPQERPRSMISVQVM